MSPRERLSVAARGGEADRKPVIAWPEASNAESDAIVVDDLRALPALVGGDRAVLAEIGNPFLVHGPSLATEFRENPEAASAKLDMATEDTRRSIEAALEAGADGIFYRLHGARVKHSTPMEYGGIYLERDRELLEEIQDARFNVLFLVGDDDLYLDFVSDLPAHVIAWDRESTGFSSAQVRALRAGAQASSDPTSEILLHHPGVRIADRFDCY